MILFIIPGPRAASVHCRMALEIEVEMSTQKSSLGLIIAI